MYQKLQQLYNGLDTSVPKYQPSTCRHIDTSTEVSVECKKMLEHLIEMKQVHLQHNVYGIQTIRDTNINVETNMERKGFIMSRYGRIEIPAKVIM